MNNQKLKDIITSYKRHFKNIHHEEIYKWRAVKCFEENWDIDANDFPTMLDNSLAIAKNLLDSGMYFPKRMIYEYAIREPEVVRQLFKDLYNEDVNLIDRIEFFRNNIVTLHKKYFNVKNNYQDYRAILVYLCLHYPDRYFLFKFTMFKEFVRLVDYPFKPKANDIQTVLQYLSLCNIMRAEIIKDSELLEFHKTRITEQEYADNSCHILTQDIIYAAVKHIEKFESSVVQESALSRLLKEDKTFNIFMQEEVVLNGSFTNYIENEKEKKRVGDLGELLVLQYEQEKLKSLKINKEPQHTSKSKVDGLGYDILSFDKNGSEIFIEVKTTSSNINTPFYITRNELERSRQDREKFFLYRLYEFDDKNNKAKYYIHQGDLSDLCINPVLYRVISRIEQT